MKRLIVILLLLVIGIQVSSQEDQLEFQILQVDNISQIMHVGSFEPNGQLAFNDDGSLLATVDPIASDLVVIWDVYDPFATSVIFFSPEILDVNTISFTKDSETLALGGTNGEIVIWNMDESMPDKILRGPSNYRVENITFNSFNDQLAASYIGAGTNIIFWENLDDLNPTFQLATRGEFEFSPFDPNLVALDLDHYIRFYDTEREAFYSVASVHENTFHTIIFNDLEQELLTADIHSIRVWDLADLVPEELNEQPLVLEDPIPQLEIEVSESELFEVHAIWQANLIIAANRNNQLLFFDIETGELVHTVQENDVLRFVEVSPNGDLIAVSTASSGTILWGIVK